MLKAINVVHRAVLRATGGRIGGRAKNMPVLELVTTGRNAFSRAVLPTPPLPVKNKNFVKILFIAFLMNCV